MPDYIQQPEPLLTSRVEFKLIPRAPLSSIASRIEFTEARLVNPGGDDRQNIDVANLPPPPEPPRRNLRNTNKIMKPHGEPGRPNSGGFNVEAALKAGGWARDDVEALTVGNACCWYMSVTDERGRRPSATRRGKSLISRKAIAFKTRPL